MYSSFMHLGYIRLRKISNCLPPQRLQNTVQYVSTVGPVAVVLVLGPEVAVARAERLRLRRGGGGRGRLRPARPRVLTEGGHRARALDHLPVANVLVAMHVDAEPG